MKNVLDAVLQMAVEARFECEAYGEAVERFSVDVHRGAVESVDRSIDKGVGVRLSRDGRTGFAWTNDLGPDGLRSMIAVAGGNALAGDPDEVDALAGGPDEVDALNGVVPAQYAPHASPASSAPVTPPALSAPHAPAAPSASSAPPAPSLQRAYPSDLSAEVKTAGALAMEEAALAFGNGIVNTEGAGYSEVTAEVYVAGTRGFSRFERRGMCACAIGAVAARGDEVRTGWHYAQALEPAAIDFCRVGREAARRATSMLGAAPLATGRYPVVFDGLAFAEIVAMLAETLSGEMASRGTTVFAGRVGRPVGSPLLELVDDPFLAGGCFNSAFDDEGVPRRRRVLIEAGVCRGFLHTSRSARRAGPQASAGNAARGSYRYPPLPGPTNLFVMPAPAGSENPIGALREGIYILDVMGLHTADPISGDFSLGIRGLSVRGGRPVGAVSEMTISGGVLGLLEGIRMLGAELKFAGHCASPDVLVEGLSLGGR